MNEVIGWEGATRWVVGELISKNILDPGDKDEAKEIQGWNKFSWGKCVRPCK